MNFNTKYLNRSAWITIILTYVLPYRSSEGFATAFGYPLAFLTVYDKPVGTTLMLSYHLNALGLAVNIFLIYIVIEFISTIKHKYLIKTKKR